MLLQVKHLTKTFGAATVLDDITFAIDREERIGVVGANGAGKTTLLRLLTGEETPDSGSIRFAPDTALGYLSQSAPDDTTQTIERMVRAATGDLRLIEARMRELEAAMASATAEPELAPLLEEYGQLTTRFQERGGYDLDHRIEEVLSGMRLDYLPRDQEISKLSGGEKARVGIAALLLRSPDLLLLDEPTNHLDVATLEWLEGYLARYSGAVLMVSHDRQFLNRTVNRIFEVDDTTHQLRRYEGDYDAYAAAKAAQRAKWEEEYERQQEEIKELQKRMKVSGRQVAHNRQPTDNDKTAYNFFGERVAQTVSRNVRDAEVRLARIEANPIEKPPPPMRFAPQFQGERLQSRTILGATGVTKRFGGRLILDAVDFLVGPGARILLTGPNGAGKTTLLRLLLGLEEPDEGEIRRAPGLRVGYLPQDPVTGDPDRTILDAYREGLVGYEGTLVAGLLGNGLFRLEDLPKRVGQLSLGQRRKLEITRLVALRPNALVLDEPTNYLSLDVLEVFEKAALEFPGPVIAVSHDRWFARRFGGEVWRLADGTLTRE
jgi:macrolide transport system ATP-binding/permease protein